VNGKPPLPHKTSWCAQEQLSLPREQPVEVNGKLKTTIRESYLLQGTRWRRKVAVRFPADAFGFFIDYGPWGRLSLLTELSNRYISCR